MKMRYNKTEKKVPILLKYNKLTPKKTDKFQLNNENCSTIRDNYLYKSSKLK